MADKYYPEKLRFLTETLKQFFAILLAVIAGSIILLRQQELTPMDRTLLVLAVFLVLLLIILIFVFGFQASDVLNQIKSNDRL